MHHICQKGALFLTGAITCTHPHDYFKLLFFVLLFLCANLLLFLSQWLKSRNSEAWLLRRTNFIRSLSVMSMVGYILGLGDRHPCNLMMEKQSGKIIHIDFGKCALMRTRAHA